MASPTILQKTVDQYSVCSDSVLGTGGFGTVYSGENPLTNEAVAIKYFRPPVPEKRDRHIQLIQTELKLLSKVVKHKNIVRLLHYKEIDRDFYLVLELCQCDLHEYALENEFAPTLKLQFIEDIVTGVRCLHKRRIIHRDITPRNILVKRGAGGAVLLKLTAFGLSHRIPADKSAAFPAPPAPVGSHGWRAPEVADSRSQRHTMLSYSMPADVYSAGQVCAAVADHQPYAGLAPKTGVAVATEVTIEGITEEVVPELQAAKLVIARMLIPLPMYRCKIQEVCDEIRAIRGVGCEVVVSDVGGVELIPPPATDDASGAAASGSASSGVDESSLASSDCATEDSGGMSRAGKRSKKRISESGDGRSAAQSKEARLTEVSIADLTQKMARSGVLKVRVLHYTYQRGQYGGTHKRFLHLNVGDPTGYLLVKAFDQEATKLDGKLSKQKQPWYLELRGDLRIKSAKDGPPHFCPDGALYLASGTAHKLVDGGEVECPAPVSTTLSGVRGALPAYRSRVAVTDALVVKLQLRESANQQRVLEMALYDGSETTCTLLSVRVSGTSDLAQNMKQGPFSIAVKEAWVYLYGDRKQIRANEGDVVLVENDLLKLKWNEAKKDVDPGAVFKIPYKSVKSIADIHKACRKLKHGQYRYFELAVSIAAVAAHTESTDLSAQTFLYRGCADDTCRVAVNINQQLGDGDAAISSSSSSSSFECPKCRASYSEASLCRWRYRVVLRLSDCSSNSNSSNSNGSVQWEAASPIQQFDDVDIDFETFAGDAANDDCDDDDDDDVDDDDDDDDAVVEELKVTAFDGPADKLMKGMTCLQLSESWRQRSGQRNVMKRFEYLRDSQWKVGIEVKKDVKDKVNGPMIMTVTDVLDSLGKGRHC